MSIGVGQQLPEATFQVLTSHGVEDRSTTAVFRDKKVVVFGVPGAFTPACHRKHLPGYLEHAAALKAAGVDNIFVTSTNDAFVLEAWLNATGASGSIDFLADGAGYFAQAIGLSFDATDRGLGLRSRRYSMVVDDGVVTRLVVEDSPTKVEASGAAALLKDLAAKRAH